MMIAIPRNWRGGGLSAASIYTIYYTTYPVMTKRLRVRPIRLHHEVARWVYCCLTDHRDGRDAEACLRSFTPMRRGLLGA